MTIAHPLKKESELIKSINEMVFSGLNQIRLDEILAEAKKMQDMGGSYYISAKRVMGMVAALRGNVEEADIQFKAAIAHGGKSFETLKDYAIALWNLRQIMRNLKILDELAESLPDDPEIIRTAIRNHWAAYDVEGVRKLLQQAEILNLPDDEVMLELRSNLDLDLISTLLTEAGATWKQVCSRIELTSNVLNKLGLYSPRMKSKIIDGLVFHEYLLFANLDSVMRAEDAINDAIANMSFSPADRVIYFSCAQA